MNVTQTVDKLVADTSISIDGTEIIGVKHSISTPSSDDKIVTEKAITDYLANPGWYGFTVTAMQTNTQIFDSNSSTLVEGMPVRCRIIGDSKWLYGIIHDKNGTQFKIAGTYWYTHRSDLEYQYGDLNKVKRFQFFISKTPDKDIIPSVTDGMLYEFGMHSHLRNVGSDMYIIEMAALFGNYTDSSYNIIFAPYTTADYTNWHRANTSDLTLTTDNQWKQYADSLTPFHRDYYYIPYLGAIDFYMHISGSYGVENLQIYATCVIP